MNSQQRAEAVLADLPKKQRDVLVLIAGGLTIEEIGDRLHRSPHTIKHYRDDAYRALGINKATQAAVICALAGAVTEWEAA